MFGVSPLVGSPPLGASAVVRQSAGVSEVSVDPRSTLTRQRFSIVHEIGHVILSQETGRPLHETGGALVERFLEDFASYVLLPDELLDLWSRMFAGQVNTQSIVVGATRCSVSVLVFVKRLGEIKLLDRRAQGVVVGALDWTRRSRNDRALRVKVAAYPSWGFVPFNTRLTSIGLSRSVPIFEKATQRDGVRALRGVKELLRLKILPGYRWVRLSANCDYRVFVGAQLEASSILATFDWPPPPEHPHGREAGAQDSFYDWPTQPVGSVGPE